MKIVIATGIYPPEVGGPAYYAQELAHAFVHLGHVVQTVTYGGIKKLPTGVRHVVYFFLLLKKAIGADTIITLDTFSVGLPAVLVGKVIRIPVLIRTGGDFLWESYVERTGEHILLSDFYTEQREYTLREKCIYILTRFVLRSASVVVFSTIYQRDIFVSAYDIDVSHTRIIENYYGPKEETDIPKEKTFVCFSRQHACKNLLNMHKAFKKAQQRHPDIDLAMGVFPREEFLKRLTQCYAVILVSLSDISPNVILEAVQYNKPFIVTRENGLTERLKNIGILVDPLDTDAIANAICRLVDDKEYALQHKKVRDFFFTHTYEEIAEEFIEIIKRL